MGGVLFVRLGDGGAYREMVVARRMVEGEGMVGMGWGRVVRFSHREGESVSWPSILAMGGEVDEMGWSCAVYVSRSHDRGGEFDPFAQALVFRARPWFLCFRLSPTWYDRLSEITLREAARSDAVLM